MLTSEVPYPPTDSNRAVVYHLLRHFQNEHDVTLVAIGAGDAPEDVEVVRGLVRDLVVIPHEIKKTFSRRVASLLSVWPFGVLLYRNAAFGSAVEKLLAAREFDIILGGNI